MENEGILYVFLVFQTEEVGQKDGCGSQTQLRGVALIFRPITYFPFSCKYFFWSNTRDMRFKGEEIMKATGIVRRVDDLGRIVIPKEIRRTLRIREGDPLEIYTEKDGGVIFRKYSPMGDLQEFASQMCESIVAATGHIAAVADRDSIIALHGAPKRDLMDKPNSPELERIMEQRKNYLYQSGESPIRAADGTDKYHLGAAAPILSQGDLMGCVMLLLGENDSPLQDSDRTLARTAASFLGMQLES